MATTNGNLITFSATDTNYTLTAPGAFKIFGNNLTNNISGNNDANLISGADGADSLLGNGGNDSLYGGDGGDTLNGGTGADFMAGGYGNDSYVVDDAGDVVVENANEGTMDIVYTSTVSNYTLPGEVEFLTLQGAAHLNGVGNQLGNRMIGNAGNNVLSGLDGNDQLYGGLGNDTLYGGNGNDILNGQQNENELHGGAGNDTYYITVGLDTVFENANEGTDTIVADASFTLADNFENLTFSGSSNAIGRGNAARNTLIGNDGDNVLYGEGGDDSLDGRAGNNTLVGGTGNDTYTISTPNDTLIESAGEGVDVVIIKYDELVDFNLADNLENIQVAKDIGLSVYGNNSNNMIALKGRATAYGLGGNDTITQTLTSSGEMGGHVFAGDGDDIISVQTVGSIQNHSSYIKGGSGNDRITAVNTSLDVYGEEGDDVITLTGGAGSHLYGGTGNDIYIIDRASWESGSQNLFIGENKDEGIDTIKTEVSFSLDYKDVVAVGEPYSFYAVYENNVENLTLTGTSNINGYGNNLNNYLYGNSGNNLLEGREGNDYLIGYGGSDTLLGGDGNDTLSINHSQPAGVILNSTGAVQMTGGAGVDVFWMPRGLVGDHTTGVNQISITDFVHGVDRIMLSIGRSSATPTVLNTLTASAGDTLASLVNQAAAANASSAAPALSTFTFSGDTYLVFDQSAGASFNASADLAVKIVGTPVLTLSDFTYQSLT
ncbi:calcium-binding protein [Rivihabitans pingtungensis]|uniref:calcium-binding protein n=1 Tax=Rivihabitans pingtungensis TaxID=1054498 RepID=UPI002352F6FE|nr:calcium-binding protein [Rivihabitans pingtungensis]